MYFCIDSGLTGGLFNTGFLTTRASFCSARERSLTGEPELVGTYLTMIEIFSVEDEFLSKCPSSKSSGVSQSCFLSQHISFRPLSIHNKVLFQSRFLDEGILSRLCQIVFGDLPKCASKGEQSNDCCVTLLRHFIIFNSADSSQTFG